jgi:hypothetical protein
VPHLLLEAMLWPWVKPDQEQNLQWRLFKDCKKINQQPDHSVPEDWLYPDFWLYDPISLSKAGRRFSVKWSRNSHN